MGLIVLLVTFALMWALFILPQQRRVKQHKALVEAIGPGDKVVTAGGIIGTVIGIIEDEAILEVADGIELRILRGAISRRMDGDAIEPLDAADAAELEKLDEEGLAPGPVTDEDAWPTADRDDDRS
jgi:preprotein translocase subunit YajC